MRAKNLNANEKQFILNLIPDTTYEDIVILFEKEFGRRISIHTAKRLGKINKVYRIENFKKGQVPWNKGKRFPGRINSGCFKKGHQINALPIGTEQIDEKRERTYIKTELGWKFKQRYLYELYHDRKLLPKERIIFLDGNKNNFAKENLVAVKTDILGFLRCSGLLKLTNPNLKKVAIDISKGKKLLKELNQKYGKVKHRETE